MPYLTAFIGHFNGGLTLLSNVLYATDWVLKIGQMFDNTLSPCKSQCSISMEHFDVFKTT